MQEPALKDVLQEADRFQDPGRLEDAVAVYRTVLLADPDRCEALHGLALVLCRLGRVAESEAVLQTGIERHPQAPELRVALARTLADWDRLDAAVAAAETANALAPGNPETLILLAELQERRGETKLARIALEAAAAASTAHAPALTALGRMQRQSGMLPAAHGTLERAVAAAGTELDRAHAHVQQALAWLADGQIAHGFRAYDARWKTGFLPNLNPDLPPWTGDELAGRVLLVRCEQGMSECLQFFRLAAAVEGGTVIVEAPVPLVPLLRASHRVTEVVPQGEPLPPADYWAPLLSLPRLLRIDAGTIPDDVPYLRPDLSRLSEWRERLGPGLKIGIAWNGGEPLFEKRRRAVPLGAFEPLSRLPGVKLISLQKGEGRQDMDAVPFPVYDLTDEMDEGPGAFLDTAIVMQECALIVSTDTAVAHLAGALARPCWTMLPAGGDWRFGRHTTECPWYPTMECVRRPHNAPWSAAFEHIDRRLQAIREGRDVEPSDVTLRTAAEGVDNVTGGFNGT